MREHYSQPLIDQLLFTAFAIVFFAVFTDKTIHFPTSAHSLDFYMTSSASSFWLIAGLQQEKLFLNFSFEVRAA